jgi:hypothetical protein
LVKLSLSFLGFLIGLPKAGRGIYPVPAEEAAKGGPGRNRKNKDRLNSQAENIGQGPTGKKCAGLQAVFIWSESQITNNKRFTVPKFETPKVLVIDFWDLRFICSLVLEN